MDTGWAPLEAQERMARKESPIKQDLREVLSEFLGEAERAGRVRLEYREDYKKTKACLDVLLSMVIDAGFSLSGVSERLDLSPSTIRKGANRGRLLSRLREKERKKS